MFSDPNTAIMAMIMLCFAGMIVMFIFIIRSHVSHSEELREALRKQQLVMADLERQVMEMSFAIRRLSGLEDSQNASVTRPSSVRAVKSDEDLSSMLEAAARGGRKLELGDDLLAPPSVSRPLAEEYDPANDPHLFDDAFGSKKKRQQGIPEARVGTAGGKGRTPLSIRLDD